MAPKKQARHKRANQRRAEGLAVARSIRLTEAEYQTVCAAATGEHKSAHAFMRDAVIEAAGARDLPSQLRAMEAATRAARRHGLIPARQLGFPTLEELAARAAAERAGAK